MNENHKRLIREIILFAVAFLPLLFAVVSYGRLPESIPTHWNLAGEIDGWTPKGIVYLLMMSTPVFFNLLLLFAAKADKKQADTLLKSKIYFMVRFVIVLVFVVALVLSTYSALGNHVPIDKVMPLVMGILFLMIAHYLPRIPYNYFISYRTPWTLYSKDIWQKTHSFAGTMFFITGVYMLLGQQLFPPESLLSQILWIICTMMCSFAPVLYSIYLYQKEVKAGKKKN